MACLTPSLTLVSICPLVLCLVAGQGAAAPAAPVAPQATLVVVGLVFEGDVQPGVRRTMAEKLVAGLSAARAKLADQTAVVKAVGGRVCQDPGCWKSVAAALGCRYAVGGTVKGEERTYKITLFLGDAFTGATHPIEETCELCGLVEAANKLDLLASALVAKLQATERASARVAVSTDPPGAMISIDGDQVGPAPRELDLPAGPHRISASAPGYAVATRSLTTVAGVQERIDLQLLHLGTSSPARVVGWVGVAVGAAAIGTGIALLALHGAEVQCEAGVMGVCQRETRTEAGVALGIGVAAVGVGGYLLYRGYRRTGRVTAATASSSSGLRFSF